jgi:hypothetical protein
MPYCNKLPHCCIVRLHHLHDDLGGDAMSKRFPARKVIDQLHPKAIQVAGRKLEVIQTGHKPRVILPIGFVSTGLWKDLPNDGVFLPDGTAVEVAAIVTELDYFCTTDVPHLKRQVRQTLNQLQWDLFSWPELTPVPTTEDDIEIPPVQGIRYGTDALTEKPLVAYGTVRFDVLHLLTSIPRFVTYWCDSQEEAEQYRAEAVTNRQAVLDCARARKTLE